jgi:hypothetical protein
MRRKLTRGTTRNEPGVKGGSSDKPLVDPGQLHHASEMFVVSEAEAAAIRTAFEQRGELSAAIELRRLFPGITDNLQARDVARVIAGWKPLPPRPARRLPTGSPEAVPRGARRHPVRTSGGN